ncbi:MAG: diphthine--ammonia ligase [Nitrososphaerota archaeon]|jgi:ABC transporter with metal-binding/Fe-S-binding domain ATP-binding protein|nr:diphthine--ammonia ligase [Nitrososphaerota archaeon]
MKVGVLYSGGKDSNFALSRAMREHSLECLITLEPSSEDSMLFHYPNTWLTKLQASSLGVPQIYLKIAGGQEEKSALKEAILRAKSEFGIEGVVTGGVKSEFQKSSFKNEFESAGLEAINPIWGINEEIYLYTLLREGLKIMVTSVSALGLGREWLGRILDLDAISELVALSKEYRFNPSLEGGEGETLVLDMPLFKQKLEVLDTEMIWDGYRGFLKIKSAHLMEKGNVV